MADQSDSPLQEFEKTYCPPLDPALLAAIVLDYDLTDQAQVELFRATLDELRLSAWEQEDLPFDPSGTSGLSLDSNTDGMCENTPSHTDTVPSRETDLTSLTSGMSGFNLGEASANGRKNHVSYIVRSDGTLALHGFNEEDKIGCLSEMFRSTDRFTIKHTLHKAGGDVDRAMDELLNYVFFDEQIPDEDGVMFAVPKGVDGFHGADTVRKKGRRRKAKGKALARDQNARFSDYAEPLSPAPASNIWATAEKDVDFIFSLTSAVLPKEKIRSAYHANGASLPITIRGLADAHAAENKELVTKDELMASQVSEIRQQYPEITKDTSVGLLIITRQIPSAAKELAEVMVTVPTMSQPSLTEMIKITSTLPPLDDEDEVAEPRHLGPRFAHNLENVRSAADVHFAAGAEAFSKASTAYKRGKSDRLMGGAAAYYSSVGRDQLELAKRNAAAAADALVEQQSTPNRLDLHGVSVQDAVRISRERVSAWWESLGDAKLMGGSRYERTQGGFHIVTGKGRHSHDGTSRLGPAVGKMLIRDGWKVEVGEGALTVVGVMRQR
ncbi:Smr domain protein [Aspergillus saccharolyticus JOP 1030-1]|uniref:Smr domain protein n=1 Tax=Aspergillus saccharolyticus JOP 1030-1 TaxID=1450539 RepID=A0A318ZCI7_9EURO|nr:Smr domain protein [Aspergillus saccharolyticus JOP 1030-1]PYH45079.1 Smr domain protein [Aspergillus saccharolyticus JOP 1030-1]